jgi:membrane protein DedA with SNARE-associated domain
LKFTVTVILSAISALVWNAILVYFGYALGDNWREIARYMALYSKAISAVCVLLLAAWLIRRYVMKRRADNRKSS